MQKQEANKTCYSVCQMLDKIIPVNIHNAPVSHIIVNQPIDQKRYDHLYEQWLNPNHNVWKDFVEEQSQQKKVPEDLKKLSVSKLKSLLNKLVNLEDYEKAVKIRDEISKRENKT